MRRCDRGRGRWLGARGGSRVPACSSTALPAHGCVRRKGGMKTLIVGAVVGMPGRRWCRTGHCHGRGRRDRDGRKHRRRRGCRGREHVGEGVVGREADHRRQPGGRLRRRDGRRGHHGPEHRAAARPQGRQGSRARWPALRRGDRLPPPDTAASIPTVSGRPSTGSRRRLAPTLIGHVASESQVVVNTRPSTGRAESRGWRAPRPAYGRDLKHRSRLSSRAAVSRASRPGSPKWPLPKLRRTTGCGADQSHPS